ncbi:MAG: lysophospholipid acyltransferase family protein [Chloroflexaceae bacterium]|nr:lysophospholipid acyltransferase family protein [Chloroflexaceae bacterium]
MQTIAPPTSTRLTPRIPAAKNWLGDEAIFYLLARPALRRSFSRIWWQHVGPLPEPTSGPFIFYLNHAAWWDGYMMMLTHRAIFGRRFESYLMMEEKQLKAYRFFTWCGAFSINRHDAQDTAASISYISRLLRERRKRVLFIFPQGKIVHSDKRPLVTYPGVARIARSVGKVNLCPIIFRYEFRGEQRPEAFIRVGPGQTLDEQMDEEQMLRVITERLATNSDAMRDAVVNGDTSQFQVLLQGRPGIDRMFDRLLALLPKKR